MTAPHADASCREAIELPHRARLDAATERYADALAAFDRACALA